MDSHRVRQLLPAPAVIESSVGYPGIRPTFRTLAATRSLLPQPKGGTNPMGEAQPCQCAKLRIDYLLV